MTNPFTVEAGQRLLGEVIAWSCTGIAVPYSLLVQHLKDCGLDEKVARELAPRHAFARACRKLSEARIINQLEESEEVISFQFTKERKEEDRFQYDYETVLYLSKKSGKVTGEKFELVDKAQTELDHAIGVRSGSDITRITQRLFDRRKADLFPIRDQGGVYFVAALHLSFVEQVQQFLAQLGARMKRLPIAAGTPQGDTSVRDSVKEGLAAVIAEHEDAIAAFGEDTRPDTYERAAQRIRETRFKIEVYAEYLGSQKEGLEAALAGASLKLKEKVATLAQQAAASA